MYFIAFLSLTHVFNCVYVPIRHWSQRTWGSRQNVNQSCHLICAPADKYTHTHNVCTQNGQHNKNELLGEALLSKLQLFLP